MMTFIFMKNSTLKSCWASGIHGADCTLMKNCTDLDKNETVRGSLLDIIEKTGFDIIGGVAGEPLHVGLGHGWANDWLNHGNIEFKRAPVGTV